MYTDFKNNMVLNLNSAFDSKLFFQHGTHLSEVKSLVEQLHLVFKCIVVSMVSLQREGRWMKYSYPSPVEIILTAQTERERIKQGLRIP